MHEEVLGKALFASIAVWFLVVAVQVVQIDVAVERIASVAEHSGSAVG